MLDGKKSYILAGLIAVGALASLVTGVMDSKEVMEALAAAAALVCVKSAVAKAEK